MNTPILDFVKNYSQKNTSRFHMPGHKGQSFLGFEHFDITEIKGADALYEAESIIAESEKNATSLFQTEKTLFSTEGSSQCIRAMLYLAITYFIEKHTLKIQTKNQTTQTNNSTLTINKQNIDAIEKNTSEKPYIIANRNVHKAFLYACALIDFDIVWLYPKEMHSLCSCYISPAELEIELKKHTTPPACVYVTSPDYLGGQLDIKQFSEICHKYNTILAVDNAHGAYLHFLENPTHPIDLGADICCDSAHKTLPVLTGGAYLQISQNAPKFFSQYAKQAMALFGSTSPSYLTLASLDLCNQYLSNNYKEKLNNTTAYIETIKKTLRNHGWHVEQTDPLKITIQTPYNITGNDLADKLQLSNIECEYADNDYIVFMATPENSKEDYELLIKALGKNTNENKAKSVIIDTTITSKNKISNTFEVTYSENSTSKNSRIPLKPIKKLSVREALFATHELIPVKNAVGKICGAPTVGCPPAIPIVISGEEIDEDAIKLFEYYGITNIDVVKMTFISHF